MSTTDLLNSTEQEIARLRREIDASRRQEELKKLKEEMAEITLKAQYDLGEFEGGLKEVDTERLLKNKQKSNHLMDKALSSFLKMMSVRPVIRNLVAIFVLMGCVVCLLDFLHIKALEGKIIYFCYFIEVAVGIQILKSATRSLLIPVAATLIGAVVANTMPEGSLFLMHHQLFYQILMVTGIVGVMMSVFTID
jgi:hypothetical protein